MRKRTAGRARAVVIAGLVALFATLFPATAMAAGEDLIVFDDDSSCEVRMQNVHLSGTVAGDVSVAVDVRCHPAGAPGAALVVDEIAGQTSISYSEDVPLPGLFDPTELGTCERIAFANRASATIPCHQRGGLSGYYIGRSTVTVTFRGQTEEVEVVKQDFLGGVA